MNEGRPKKLSTEPYKGVRDFFPPDMAVEKAIFGIWRSVCERYGYEEYGASVLEPADIYRAKTGDEIVNEQTYTFKDRGDREVTLRPEMTPSAARMVAAERRNLPFPVRWYSIPNLFRYEQPQRGRVREHWQLNVDLFGVETRLAEIETINMAYDIMRAYGLKDADFEIRLNDRKLMDYVTRDVFGLDQETAKKVSKLIDRKEKMPADAFQAAVTELFAPDPKLRGKDEPFMTLLNSRNFEEFVSRLPATKEEHSGLTEINEVIAGLEKLGITNVRFDQTLMRGFDYYTGIVFEIYDLNPANRRSVFGGGRYDDLLSLFGSDRVTAVGFGAGDVIARDIMETYGTLPEPSSPADLAICIVGAESAAYAFDLAQSLRAGGLRVFVDLSAKKVGDQIANASKRRMTRVICVGEEEVKTGKLRLKDLSTGTETEGTVEQIREMIHRDDRYDS
ncbi:MAG: histidine--tRNA ligase [Patescibacteria group bacterium]|nr:histidine--tRNA ligase [Patescibacteria group bacterium]